MLNTTDADCTIVELRQYTLRTGQRDALIDLFDREFIETQEAHGIAVMGQFRDADDADRFTWLRGFRDMPGRAAALSAFYGGSAWAAHRQTANATMVDSDNVLLLRPAWPGAGIRVSSRPCPPEPDASRGLVVASIFHLQGPASPELLDACRRASAAEIGAGAERLGCYVTDPTTNNFPRLPIREGESVLVGFAAFESAAAFEKLRHGEGWDQPLHRSLSASQARATDTLRLMPTTRSAIRHGGQGAPR